VRPHHKADAGRSADTLTASRRFSLALALACALLTVGPYAVRPSMLTTRTFDPDEFQHLHAAWSYQQGMVPFRDFFEHHMPGIYYLLGPVLRFYDIAGSTDDTIRAAYAARGTMLVCAIAIALFTFLLARRYGGTTVAWLASALLSTNIVYVSRTLEIRPDVPAVALWTASQYALFAALSPREEADRSRRLFFAAAGLLLGGALVFTQKVLLAGPGFAVFSILYLVRSAGPPRSQRLANLVAFVACAVIPLGAVVAQFWRNDAIAPLVAGVWTNNLGWIQEVTPSTTLHWMLLRDPFFCALSTAGFVVAAATLASDWTDRRAAMLLPTLSLFGGMAFMPAPFPQYLLLILPASAIYGSDFLWRGAALAGCTATDERRHIRTFAAAACAFAIVAILGLSFAQPYFRHPTIYPLVGVGATVLALAFVRQGLATGAVIVLLLAMSTYSVQQLTWMAGLSNADVVAAMRFIHDSTTAESRVMDGFSGLGWFRHHAAFYWFTAPGVRPRLSASDKSQMVAMLEGCAQPEIVILDEQLRRVSPDVATAVVKYYRRTPYDLVWQQDPARNACPRVGDDKSAITR
jgi:Dolichyl-phosphate-mannose-protein mannosyltransferase